MPKGVYDRKLSDKDIRQPIGEEETVNKMSHDDKVRLATGRQTKLDASYYLRLPEYKEMTLFWENNEDGAVEKWLYLGASLVPRRSKSLKHFKGFTDQKDKEWECVPVGTAQGGGPLLCYLLFMPKDEYHSLRIQPKEDRNKEILKALGIGKAPDESRIMPEVTGIKTYAPNLPSGGKGFEQTHDA